MGSVSVNDIAASAGKPITDPVKVSQVEAWITGAETMIRLRLGTLDLLDPDAVTLVITEAVTRRFNNPKGKTYERLDDYSYNIAPELAKAGLYITDEEWGMLAPQDVDPGAFSIIPGMTGTR